MKLLIMVLGVVLLAVPIQAWAQSAQDVSFDYTGLRAEDGYGIGWYSSGSVTLGGNDVLGIAQQFTLSQSTDISDLDVEATSLYPVGGLGPYSTTLTYDLYGGSIATSPIDQNLIPLSSSLLLQSSPLTFTANVNANDNPIVNPNVEQLSFNTDLQPGTYWIAEQTTGPSGADVTLQQRYIDPPTSQRMGAVATPERPTWVYFIFILGFIFWNGRNWRMA